MGVEIINIRRSPSSSGGKANGTTGTATNVHTVRGADLRVNKPVSNQGGLGMVLKLM